MRRFSALQKVAGIILRKWIWLLAFSFVFLSSAFSVYLVWHYAYSGHRYSAITRLLFTPRRSNKIDNMSDKQLLSILERVSLKRKVAERMPMLPGEKECLGIDLEIEQERRPSNLYTLTARSPSWVGAVRKVNTYAEILIDEYASYRKRELDNLRESIQLRIDNVRKRIAELDSEENIAKGQAGVASPVETLTTINALLSDQRKNLSMISVEITNEEVKKRKLEAEVGKIGPAIIANAGVIRKRSEALGALDKELSQLRHVYTDINPKVVGKLEERRLLLEEYTAFLKSKGMADVSVENIDRIERAAGELADATSRLDALEQTRRSLEREIADNEKRSGELITVIPAIERIKVNRADHEKTLRDLEEGLDLITHLSMSIATDLQQIERSDGAGDRNPLNAKNFAIAIGAALVCTTMMAFWILAAEFIFGKVRNAKELAAWGDVETIGSLPKEGAMSAEEERDALGVVALNYCNTDLPKGVVLACRLPGAGPQPKFRDALDWSLAMSGQRGFVLQITPGQSFAPPEDAETLVATAKKDQNGWFPAANRYSLAPTELQMLQADIAALRAEFDSVFVFMPGGLSKGGSFFSQLLGICDCVFMEVCADTTPRSALEYVRRHVRAAGKPMIGIVAGADARSVRREMETAK